MQRVLRTCALALAAILAITGCIEKPVYMADGTPLFHPFGSNDRGNTIITELRKQHVNVVVAGDTVRMILPSDQFFLDESARINPKKLGTLALIAEYMQICKSAPIVVTGHTDDIGAQRHRDSLSAQQAHVVVAELWSHGVKWARADAIGHADRFQIASDDHIIGSGMNRRVEIRLD